jgi:hypothetical protein
MRNLVPMLAAILGLAWALPLSSADALQWPQLTVEEAAAICRQFAGDPDLELTYTGIDDSADVWGAPWMFGLTRDHVFESGYREYRVGVRDTCGIEFLDASAIMEPEAYYGEPFDEEALHARQMAVEDARLLADAAVAAHHPGAGLLAMYEVLDYPTTGRSEESVFAAYYRFNYEHVFENGAIAPSAASVAIDSVFGTVVAYTQIGFPVLVDWHPILDEEAAIAAAATALLVGGPSDAEVEDLRVTPPDQLGLERLIWTVSLSGYSALDEEHPWERFHAAVDAHTGEVPYWSALAAMAPASAAQRLLPASALPPGRRPLWLSRGGSRISASYPPVRLDGHSFVYLLNLPGLGAKMELLGPGRAKLKARNGEGYVDAKTGELTLNGRPFLRYGKPVIIRGRTYVPVDFARRLLGINLTVRRAPPYGR